MVNMVVDRRQRAQMMIMQDMECAYHSFVLSMLLSSPSAPYSQPLSLIFPTPPPPSSILFIDVRFEFLQYYYHIKICTFPSYEDCIITNAKLIFTFLFFTQLAVAVLVSISRCYNLVADITCCSIQSWGFLFAKL